MGYGSPMMLRFLPPPLRNARVTNGDKRIGVLHANLRKADIEMIGHLRMQSKDRSQVIEEVCEAVAQADTNKAAAIVRSEYPFVKPAVGGRKITLVEATQVFLRDGFVDRYAGKRLVFPPVLRVISQILPEEFPFHSHWKMTECHVAYWELCATVDHVIPVARGGADDETNWVCTSMLRNEVKSNWTLEELGWDLLSLSALDRWDGLLGWFLQFAENHKDVLQHPYLRRWHAAAMRSRSESP
jgi:hypothetical protein